MFGQAHLKMRLTLSHSEKTFESRRKSFLLYCYFFFKEQENFRIIITFN